MRVECRVSNRVLTCVFDGRSVECSEAAKELAKFIDGCGCPPKDVIDVVSQVFKNAPACVVPELITSLAGCLVKCDDAAIRWSICEVLHEAVVTYPDMLNRNFVEAVLKALDREELGILKERLCLMIGEGLHYRPELVGAEVIDALIRELFSGEEDVAIAAANALRLLAEYAHDAFSEKHVGELVRGVVAGGKATLRTLCATILEAVSEVKPELVLKFSDELSKCSGGEACEIVKRVLNSIKKG